MVPCFKACCDLSEALKCFEEVLAFMLSSYGMIKRLLTLLGY